MFMICAFGRDAIAGELANIAVCKVRNRIGSLRAATTSRPNWMITSLRRLRTDKPRITSRTSAGAVCLGALGVKRGGTARLKKYLWSQVSAARWSGGTSNISSFGGFFLLILP